MNYYRIKLELEERGISVKSFCRKINLTEQGFYQMIRNESMKIDVLERISEALGVSMSYWFDAKESTPVESQPVSPSVTEEKEGVVSSEYMDAVTDELNKLLKELSRR